MSDLSNIKNYIDKSLEEITKASKAAEELEMLQGIMSREEAHKIVKSLNTYYYYMAGVMDIGDIPNDLNGYTLQEVLAAYSITQAIKPECIQFKNDLHIAQVYTLINTKEKNSPVMAVDKKQLLVVDGSVYAIMRTFQEDEFLEEPKILETLKATQTTHSQLIYNWVEGEMSSSEPHQPMSIR